VTTLEIVLIAVVGGFALLALGGALVIKRRREFSADTFRAEIERANRDLAAAHAADNGWEPARVEAAARTAFAEQRPGASVAAIELVQVIDPPGTEDDKAVFRVSTDDGEHRLILGRQGGEWHLESFA
jgi:hypothetical protein